MTKTLLTGNNNLNSLNALKGFSLIELLVVLTIVSVLVSSISYVMANKPETLKGLTTSIVQNLYMVQQQAIRDDQPYQIKINLASNSLYFVDGVIVLSEDISITVRTAENQLIDREIAGMTFYPDASSSGGAIILESDNEIYEISVIWISGKISTRHRNKSV